MKDLLENGMCGEHVQCASHIPSNCQFKNRIDPSKPKQGSTPTNATSELIGIFQELGNKIHAWFHSADRNLRSAQSGGSITNLLSKMMMIPVVST